MERVESSGEEYWKAFRQVLDEDEDLKAIYAGTAPAVVQKGPELKPKQSETHYSTSSELDALVRKYMFATNISDYSIALKHVLRSNPEIAKKYS
jgi:hypothetical protein